MTIFGRVSIAQMIPVDHCDAGEAQSSSSPLATSFLVGRSLICQPSRVGLNLTDNEFVTYSGLVDMTCVLSTEFELSCDQPVAPKFGRLITSRGREAEGDLQTFGNSGVAGTTSFSFNRDVAFPAFVLPEAFMFHGLPYVFHLPDDPAGSIARASLGMRTLFDAAEFTVSQ